MQRRTQEHILCIELLHSIKGGRNATNRHIYHVCIAAHIIYMTSYISCVHRCIRKRALHIRKRALKGARHYDVIYIMCASLHVVRLVGSLLKSARFAAFLVHFQSILSENATNFESILSENATKQKMCCIFRENAFSLKMHFQRECIGLFQSILSENAANLALFSNGPIRRKRTCNKYSDTRIVRFVAFSLPPFRNSYYGTSREQFLRSSFGCCQYKCTCAYEYICALLHPD